MHDNQYSNIVLEWIYNHIEGTTVLEVGSGKGQNIIPLAKQGFQVTGIDISEKNVELSLNEVSKQYPQIQQRINIINDDILTFDGRKTFDTVILSSVLKKFPNPHNLFKNLLNTLSSDGIILTIVPIFTEHKDITLPQIFKSFQKQDIKVHSFDVIDDYACFIGSSRETELDISDIIFKLEKYFKELSVSSETDNTKNEILANKNEEISNQYNQLNYKYNQIVSQLNEMKLAYEQSRNEAEIHFDKVKEVKDSVRFKLGDAVVKAFAKPGVRTIKLPLTLWRLHNEGKLNAEKRKNRKNNKSKNTPRPSNTGQSLDVGSYNDQIKKIKSFSVFSHQSSNTENQLKVACILDEFSYQCYKPEANFEQLNYSTWKEQITKFKPDFLFVESAWLGNNETWKYKLINIQNQKQYPEIKKLVEYCNENKIPTVFWNKEDPPNYDRYIETAKLFDYIFTTEQNVVSKYRQHVNHDRIYSLPFAAQPSIHNPVNTNYNKREGVAFAGSWYANRHFERQLDMHNLLNPAKSFDLTIFDRFYDMKDNPSYRFPELYQSNIAGKLSYDDMLKAYRMFKVFLNVNSVNDSPTMFSRRVFELLACGTNVVTSYSKGIEEMFKGIVPISHSEIDTKNYLNVLLNNNEFAKRLSVMGIREVYSKHLYSHRFSFITEKLGISSNKKEENGVTIVTCTNRKNFLENILTNYTQQAWDKKELIIVINSNEINIDEWKELSNDYEGVKIVNLPEEATLGECLNYAIEHSSFEYIAKFDDDDYYGPHYITDAMHSFIYSGADIVGRKSIFMYFESQEMLALKYPNTENKFQDFIYGATLVFKKDVWRTVKFKERNQGEDSHFLKEAFSKGYKAFSTNPYNYVYIRRNSSQHHTWSIGEYDLLRQSTIITYSKDFITHTTV